MNLDNIKRVNIELKDGSVITLSSGNIKSITYDEDNAGTSEVDDPIYDEVVDYSLEHGSISTSMIQRKYKIGYNRAARLIDAMEDKCIIGPANGTMPREVLIKDKISL